MIFNNQIQVSSFDALLRSLVYLVLQRIERRQKPLGTFYFTRTTKGKKIEKKTPKTWRLHFHFIHLAKRARAQAMVDDDASRGEYYALRAHDLEPRWEPSVLAALLGLNLIDELSEEYGEGREDGEGGKAAEEGAGVLDPGASHNAPPPPPPPQPLREDECRVVMLSAGGREATVEVASLQALEYALMRNGARSIAWEMIGVALHYITLSTIHSSPTLTFFSTHPRRPFIASNGREAGLEVPLTHGYRLFNLEPLPPHAHVRSAAHLPGVEPPLAMQLAPLPTKELQINNMFDRC